MNDVFVSYKREDEPRVAPLVEGLRCAGLSVWWDRDISCGLSWRQTITDQLDKARCVIVVWSEASVGPQGEFVQDEAGRAKARGVILPVRIDRITEPIGFGEIQSLDLVGWRGNHRDPRFKNVVEAAKVLVAGGPRPRPALVHRARLAAVWGSGLCLFAGVLGFVADVAGLQEQICRIPGVRSACSSQGLGGVPTEEEKALWTGRTPGDCAGLRAYLDRYPNGAFAEGAGRRLQAMEVVEEEGWIPARQLLPLTVRTTFDPLATEEAARADALQRANEEARTTCAGFSAGEYRLLSATAEAQNWRCSPRGSGVACGFDGQAICQVEARRIEQRQVCR